MIKKISLFLIVLTCLMSGGVFIFNASAEDEKNSMGIMCISHRGDTAEYESNSLEAVVSAFRKGADFVSVNIRKTTDGEFVLCDENQGDIAGDDLGQVIDAMGNEGILILDFDSELKDDIYNFIQSKNALSSVIFRINDSAKNIVSWTENKDKDIQVMGVYDGFVVFTAAGYINTLSENGMSFVQYQSKNYFNEMFGSLVSKAIFSSKAKAVVPTYDPNLCGQRRDSEDGWNELIKLGFSVIETNNIDAFADYISTNENARLSLEKIYNKALSVETQKYNTVSRENLDDAVYSAAQLLERDFASSDELQSAASYLMLAMENLALKSDEDTQKGALNITYAKVIAAVLVGAAILAAQVFIHKMQRKKTK